MSKQLIVVLLSLVVVSLSYSLQQEKDSIVQFKEFIAKHKKFYRSEELTSRYQIFKSNLQTIADLNARSKSATFGVTEFSDLTPKEFKQYYTGTKPFKPDPSTPVLPKLSTEELKDTPTSFDWRTKGAVTDVKNQGQCGSCWSFSTTGNIEGQWFLAGHDLVGLSEQNLVDCDHHCMQYEGQQSCDAGCNGGLMPNAFQYVIENNGIDTEQSYPYQGVDGTCQFDPKNVGARISNWTMVPGTVDQMMAYLVKLGPMSIAVDATWWQFYLGGIFDFPWCGETLDHGVLIVGFGTGKDIIDEDTDYWIIKNSWGASWGIDGYIKVYRGGDQCGVDLFPSSALIGDTFKPIN